MVRNKRSPIDAKQRAKLAAKLESGKQPSSKDLKTVVQFLKCLTWHDDHYEYIDTDGETIEIWI